MTRKSKHPTEWVAAHIAEARARVVAIEDTVDLAFLMALSRHCAIVLLLLCFHACMVILSELRIVKDPAVIELMKHAQSITDKAFLHTRYIARSTEQQIRAELENYMPLTADALSFDSSRSWS